MATGGVTDGDRVVSRVVFGLVLTAVDGVEYYRIDGVEQMPPFLMTVVSDGDLWMFVSSTGALTAGRIDADHALFPYETDDRLHRNAGLTGPVTVIARTVEGRRQLWRPFGPERNPACRRSIAKSVLGDRLVFEEHHEDWGLDFRATWAPSSTHGWVRTVELTDRGGRWCSARGARRPARRHAGGRRCADRADPFEPGRRLQTIGDGTVEHARDLLARVVDHRPRRTGRIAHGDDRVVERLVGCRARPRRSVPSPPCSTDGRPTRDVWSRVVPVPTCCVAR